MCPSLCLRALHPLFWAFSGQIEFICRRLRCILHKEYVAPSLFFDWIFLMHARLFWAKSHLLCQHWTCNLAILFFFFQSSAMHGMFQGCVYPFNLLKEMNFNINLCFFLYWKLNFMLSTNVVTYCYVLQWWVFAAVFQSLYVFRHEYIQKPT